MVGLLIATAVRVVAAAGPDQNQSPPADPWRAAVMQHHFVEISRVHDAVIRGDLRAALPPAAELAAMRMPAGLPETVEPVVGILRQAGRLAGTAPNLRTAAAATVAMLQQCATCHQMVGIYPAPIPPKRPDVGGIVGHMLDHLKAADDLLQGLIIPSDSLWQSGAARLRTATLSPDDWPPDPKLTAEARKADAAVHALSDRARAARTKNERGAVYAELLTTCASCHSLHRGIWGPRSGR
jgi:mono/diheme cytochrome c family protein